MHALRYALVRVGAVYNRSYWWERIGGWQLNLSHQ